MQSCLRQEVCRLHRHSQAADFQDAEYYRSGGLDLINAAEAYAAGYTGKGVTLGVCDTPMNFLHPEFSLKKASFMATAGQIENGAVGVYTWADVQHGSAVAGLAAASRNGSGMQGAAYDADVMGTVSASIFGKDNAGEKIFSKHIYDAYFARPDVKVINNSWGKDAYLTNGVSA